ncbi:MAG: hypothetical protein RRY23_04270 [Alistipes sp.]
MEDYILREIDKIGKVIEAILFRIGILKKSNNDETLYETTKVELLERLDLDIDTLLENENFTDILIEKYGFSNNNLEKFAELLYDFVNTSQDQIERMKLVSCIGAIYKYLEKNEASLSLDRYYILKELEKYV